MIGKKILLLVMIMVGTYGGQTYAQSGTKQTVIIQLIVPKNSVFKYGYFADMKDFGIKNIKQWHDRVIVYAETSNTVALKNRLAKDFPQEKILVFEHPFYNFNRKYCKGRNDIAPEWENIIMTANLVADPKMQQQYLNYHATQFQKWPEVSLGFCNANFQQVLVFKNGRQLMLVISIPKGQSLDKLNPLTTKNNPRVNDWNNIMKKYQQGIEGTQKGEVWVVFKDVDQRKFIE